MYEIIYSDTIGKRQNVNANQVKMTDKGEIVRQHGDLKMPNFSIAVFFI